MDQSIAVDFDGVIHNKSNPLPGRKMGGPIEGSKEALEYLRDLGYRIIIFSYWASSEKNIKVIEDWLKFYGMPYNEITNIKPNAEAYIDDKGIRFTTWEETLNWFRY